jgi:hypothetical protein
MGGIDKMVGQRAERAAQMKGNHETEMVAVLNKSKQLCSETVEGYAAWMTVRRSECDQLRFCGKCEYEISAKAFILLFVVLTRATAILEHLEAAISELVNCQTVAFLALADLTSRATYIHMIASSGGNK